MILRARALAGYSGLHVHLPRRADPMPAFRRYFTRLLIALFVLVVLGMLGLRWQRQLLGSQEGRFSGAMLLAPVIEGVEDCVAAADASVQGCTGPSGSASTLIEGTLPRFRDQ